MTEALRALAVLLEAPRPEHAAIAAALELPVPPAPDEHTGVVVFQAYPYGSVYLGAEGMLGGEAADRVAGFWRALGGEPPAEPDHLSVLLAGVAALAEPAPIAVCTEAARSASSRDPIVSLGGSTRGSLRRRVLPLAGGGRSPSVCGALFWEHVASWMPPYLATLRRIGAAFHVAWAELAATELAELAADLGPPARLPLALRAAPALPAAPADLDELLATLLAPIRTGFVIVRDDLERAAADLGLGLRAGERRFALRALLGQDPGGVLGWLAAEARSQAASFAMLPPITGWWTARAHVGAAWLEALAALAGRHAPEQPVTR
jgi:TorA maturation chaperone TorD